MDLISYEQYQFDWAKDYLLEGSLESVQTDLGTGLIVYNSQNTIQIGDTVSLNTNGQSKEIQIVGMLSDCPFYSAAGVGTIICSEDTFEQITGESKYTVIDVQLVKGTTDEDVYVIRQMVDSSFTSLMNAWVTAVPWELTIVLAVHLWIPRPNCNDYNF